VDNLNNVIVTSTFEKLRKKNEKGSKRAIGEDRGRAPLTQESPPSRSLWILQRGVRLLGYSHTNWTERTGCFTTSKGTGKSVRYSFCVYAHIRKCMARTRVVRHFSVSLDFVPVLRHQIQCV
jgi:hypothetical protein